MWLNALSALLHSVPGLCKVDVVNDSHHAVPRDRREALKSRHRRAIVDAAAALMIETEGTNFAVDQLAERADVARRTVFNHFRSLDDVVLEVFGQILETIVDDIEANLPTTAEGQASNMFDEVAAALRRTDLVTPITRLKRMLRRQGREPMPSQLALFERAINEQSTRLAAIMMARHSDADPLVVHLVCGALVSGSAVVVQHWEQATGGVDDEDSRRVWTELLDRMISVNRNGYGSVGPRTS